MNKQDDSQNSNKYDPNQLALSIQVTDHSSVMISRIYDKETGEPGDLRIIFVRDLKSISGATKEDLETPEGFKGAVRSKVFPHMGKESLFTVVRISNEAALGLQDLLDKMCDFPIHANEDFSPDNSDDPNIGSENFYTL